MIEVLRQLGGQAQRVDVLQRMAMVLNDEFTAEDLEPRRTRRFEEKWKNNASYERIRMIDDGILEQRADGVWSLTKSARSSSK